jgi:hypothetical protein
MGIASREYIHHLVNHGKKRFSEGGGNHSNGFEGFWEYLERELVLKGGIRRMRLLVCLKEYVW